MSHIRRDLIISGGAVPRRAGGAFSPLSLSPFVWLDPSDLTTLFQDSAMTTPVTADGDPVGAMLDKSGNGLHATQATAGLRPTYRTAGGLHWLESLDGDAKRLDVTFTPAISKPYDFLVAVRFLSGGDNFVHDIDDSGQVFLYLTALMNLAAGDGGSEFNFSTDVPADQDLVITARLNNASSRGTIENDNYVTGNDGSTSSLDMMFLFARRAVKSDIRFYGHIGFNRLLADAEIAQLRTYLAVKQGRVL